jgi:hypothetical protein
MRYQAQVLAVVFSGNSPDANAHIDVESARRNLEDLRSTGDRLRKHVTELFSQDEIVLLAKQAERRAHSLTAKPDSLETGITTGKNR